MTYNRLIILIALPSTLFCAQAEQKLPLPSGPRPQIYESETGCLTVEEDWSLVHPDDLLAFERFKSAFDKKMQPSSTTKKLVQEARDNACLKAVLASQNPALFTQQYKETLIANGKNTVLNPKNYYQSLGINPTQGCAMSYKEVMSRITELRSQESLSSAEQMTLRQAAYPFRTPIGKQCYDAFINNTLQQFITDFQTRNGEKEALYTKFNQLFLAAHS